MGIALFTASRLIAPLQDLLSWFVPHAPSQARASTNATGVESTVASTHWHTHPHRHNGQLFRRQPAAVVKPAATAGLSAAGATSARSAQPAIVVKSCRPLRVLRVVESANPPSCAGRMVISGRMADVCAELDRLVANEAALAAKMARHH